MMLRVWIAALALVSACVSGPLSAGPKAPISESADRTGIHKQWWTYHEYGGHGPSRWALVNPEEFGACGSGKAQSPIHITHFHDGNLGALSFDYWQAAVSLRNTGHLLRVEFPKGNTMTLDGTTYDLVEINFHHRAEHVIRGKRAGMEAQLVHQDASGNLAVVSVMFNYGAQHPILHDLGSRWPDHKGAVYWLPGRPHPFELLPEDKSYITYTGSLTTPPCTEGVKWIIMKQQLEMSLDQVWLMEEALDGHNHRPLQARNRREAYQ